MKKYILSAVSSFLLCLAGYTQTTVMGTVVNLGSNVVQIQGQSNTALTAVIFNDVEFTIGLADQGTSNPSAASIIPTSNISNLSIALNTSFGDSIVINGRVYYEFSLTDNSNGVTSTWSANTSTPIASLTFPVDPTTLTLRLEDLSQGGYYTGGGPNGDLFWYVTIVSGSIQNGITNQNGDITALTPMFYGAGAVNNNGNSPSYVPLEVNPVPVQFTGFSAVKKDDNAVLNWAVVNEDVTTDHYLVERSLDDKTFTDIATVAVKGNGSADSYTYSDDNISALNASVIYYRVGEVDKNGQTVFTGIKAVSIASDVDIKAYPNPTKGDVTVTITLQAAADLALSLVDASGKTVQQLQVAGAKGTNTKQLDLSGYASGSYLLKVNNGTDITTLPIVKQ